MHIICFVYVTICVRAWRLKCALRNDEASLEPAHSCHSCNKLGMHVRVCWRQSTNHCGEVGVIEHVEEFPHSVISSNRKLDADVHGHIANASRVYGVLLSTTFNDEKLNSTNGEEGIWCLHTIYPPLRVWMLAPIMQTCSKAECFPS